MSRVHRDVLVEIIMMSVIRLDRDNNPVTIYEFPAAVRRLRWEMIRVGLIREVHRIQEEQRAIEEEGKTTSMWTKAFESMENAAAEVMDEMAGVEKPAPGTGISISPIKRRIMNFTRGKQHKSEDGGRGDDETAAVSSSTHKELKRTDSWA